MNDRELLKQALVMLQRCARLRDEWEMADLIRDHLTKPEDDGWLPIESAPKDCAILGYQRLTNDLWWIVPIYWSGTEWLIVQFHSDNTEHSVQPTHWRTIPKPPRQDD